MQHPNVHLPWSQWSDDQQLHLAVPYSNPFRWRTRRELMNDFRHHMCGSPNVVLHVIELAYGDRPFEVTRADNANDIQLRTDATLWHKENLINLAVQRFPKCWKYGAFLDADFHMHRHDWGLEAVHQLQHYDWVQLFSSYATMTADHRPLAIQPSFAYAYCNYDRTGEVLVPDGGKPTGYCGSPLPNTRPSRKFNTSPGATGGGWAFTRATFDACGGFLDRCILGAADWYMSFGLIGCTTDGHPEAQSCGHKYEAYLRSWQNRAFDAVKGNIGYVECFATHAWHGSKHRRGYGTRWTILRDNEYDPAIDVAPDWQGVLRPVGKHRMRHEIRKYFLSRSENDPNLYAGEKPII